MKWKIAVCMFVILFLTSCSKNSNFYTPQDGIGMNYNNISSYNDFWLTNDSFCYLNNSLIQEYVLVNESSKTKIGTNNGYGFGKIQKYKDRIYMLNECRAIDDYNSEYELKLFDIKSGKTFSICSIRNCDNFFILNDVLYYLEYKWTEKGRSLALKEYVFDSCQENTIANDVLSFGVVEDSVFYVVGKNDAITIFEYDNELESSIECGKFALEIIGACEIKNSLKVSYTPKCLLFSWVDYKTETSIVLKYSFKDGILNKMHIEGCIDGFISYNEFSYFIVYYEQQSNSKLYKFDNTTNEITQIAHIVGEGSLFVGSDDGAYVLENTSGFLKYYFEQGSSRIVCKI